MKVSREQAAVNRERIVEVAAKLFRERGFDGIGVAELMKQAGLTHGGFYGHFDSKDDLAVEACGRALDTSIEKWDRLAAEHPADPLGAISASYLREVHLQKPGSGCLIAALGPEVARQEKPVRHAFTDGLKRMMERLSAWVPGRSRDAKRQVALASFATMVGAVVMARAVDDRGFADEILAAASAALPKRGH